MRRCLRCLLVGVLTFSLAIDVATACGRRAWRSQCCPPRVVVPAHAMPTLGGPAWAACGGFVDAGEITCCGGDWPGAAWAVADSCGQSTLWACEEIPCGVALAGPPWAAVVDDAPAIGEEVIVAEHPVMPESVGTEGGVPTPAAPADQSPEPLAAIPELEPVEPASATEASRSDDERVTGESKPDESADAEEMADERPEGDERREEAEAPEAPAPVDEPAPRRNVFEEAEEGGDEEPEAPHEPPATDESSFEAPFTIDPVPGESAEAEPSPEPAVDDEAPAAEEPGIEPDSADRGRAEPLRRWIDDTASFAVVGRLLDVRDDAVEIRRADGRDVLVPLDRLSGFDRGYVAEARERIAAARSPLPDPLTTAGR